MKKVQNTFFSFIILWLYLELLTGQNRWLVLREMKYWSVFLHIQKSISVIKVPIRLFPKTAMSSCNVRSADEGSLTRQISLTQLCSQEPRFEGHVKGNYCSQRTNRSLFDRSFSEVRVKLRVNNLPTVVYTAFQSIVCRAGFGKSEHMAKACSLPYRPGCMGKETRIRGRKEKSGKQINEQCRNRTCFWIKCHRKECLGGQGSAFWLWHIYCSKWMVIFVYTGF